MDSPAATALVPHSQEIQSGYVITGKLNPLIGCPFTSLKIISNKTREPTNINAVVKFFIADAKKAVAATWADIARAVKLGTNNTVNGRIAAATAAVVKITTCDCSFPPLTKFLIAENRKYPLRSNTIGLIHALNRTNKFQINATTWITIKIGIEITWINCINIENTKNNALKFLNPSFTGNLFTTDSQDESSISLIPINEPLPLFLYSSIKLETV